MQRREAQRQEIPQEPTLTTILIMNKALTFTSHTTTFHIAMKFLKLLAKEVSDKLLRLMTTSHGIT